MSIIFGQPPYFDTNDPYFNPIGDSYLTENTENPTPTSSGKAILYGSTTGNTRVKFCLRRYIYRFDSITNAFIYYKTYKGVRNSFEQPNNVTNITELNNRSLIHSTEILNAPEPTFLTQSLFQDLFKYPKNNDYFFVEGSHHKLINTTNGPSQTRPMFYKIYRYGKITSNNVVIVYKNNNEERRSSN